MAITIIALAVVVVVGLAALWLLVSRRRRQDREAIAFREHEAGQHRQESQRLQTEAERLREEAERRRQEAAELDQRGERKLAYAGRHESVAAEKHEEIEQTSKRFRVR
jgi:hypothetical protein